MKPSAEKWCGFFATVCFRWRLFLEDYGPMARKMETAWSCAQKMAETLRDWFEVQAREWAPESPDVVDCFFGETRDVLGRHECLHQRLRLRSDA
jgi:hypothetical protein